jgi:hypothetical protein
VFKILTPDSMINRRKSFGGTATKNVLSAIRKANKDIGKGMKSGKEGAKAQRHKGESRTSNIEKKKTVRRNAEEGINDSSGLNGSSSR